MRRASTQPWLAAPLLVTLGLPVVALLWSSSPAALWSGWGTESFRAALGLSLQTSLISLLCVVLLGLPLAMWLNQLRAPWQGLGWAVVRSPLVLPPSVTGLALLLAFGRDGPFAGLELPFSALAVVLAQVIIAAPLFVETAAVGLRRVDPQLIDWARCQGWSAPQVARRVTIPIAAPSVLAGASLAWARALGEFGATLLFAGNLPGVTQTMPLAIYEAMQSDIDVAVALAVALAAVAVLSLAATHHLLRGWRRP